MDEWLFPILAAVAVVAVIYLNVKQEKYTVPDAPAVEIPETETVSAEPAATPLVDPGSDWSMWGWILLLGGLFGLTFSVVMKMSVETSGSLFGGSSEVVNLGLMFNKGVAVACSLSAIGLGVFCFAVSALLRAIGK